MPRYDYACAACGRRFEVVHGISEDGPTSCPLCGEGPVRKAFAPPAIHFKGSGWAKKERRATSAPRASSSGESGGEGSASGSEAGADGGSSSTPKEPSTTTKDASPVSGSSGD
jgi:putative FmdB family regulatory protein